MEHTEELLTMLEQIPAPAFFVRDGLVLHANTPAVQRQLHTDTDIGPLLLTGQEEYASFTDGCLYLMLDCCGIPTSVSVTRFSDDLRLFIFEQEEDQAELQSMALAAQALRAPLANVMAVADRLFPLVGEDDEPQTQEQIARINRGLYQMLRIVCNMSDAYRYSGEQSLRTELQNADAVVREIFDHAAPLLAHAGTELHYQGLNEPLYCLLDNEKLERAINNLLSNAMKFAPKAGPIRGTLSRRGKMLYLTVQDSGAGLPPHLRGSLYNRYHRRPGAEDSRYGIGLGMVLVRRAAAAHGGTVLMEEGTDFGLRVTMTIPIRQTTDPMVRSPMIHVDYAGERSHALIELSDCLPYDLYNLEEIN